LAHPDDILSFWFEAACSSPDAAAERNAFWFAADPDVDKEIWQEFGDDVIDAAHGRYDEWAVTATGRLALIILLDQFPRNIYRGTAEVFRYDASALALAQKGVQIGQLASLAVPEQAFFLMPYQHAEDIGIQDTGVLLYDAMAAEAGDDWRELAANYRNFAVIHRNIIADYGRFPHRNGALGRVSTAAEIRYLEAGGNTFGQAG
jgi:uncharacterized protein (DUF924 family)